MFFNYKLYQSFGIKLWSEPILGFKCVILHLNFKILGKWLFSSIFTGLLSETQLEMGTITHIWPAYGKNSVSNKDGLSTYPWLATYKRHLQQTRNALTHDLSSYQTNTEKIVSQSQWRYTLHVHIDHEDVNWMTKMANKLI